VVADAQVSRDDRGRIIYADHILDAKKSQKAISNDIEMYLPHCGRLTFVLLEDALDFEFANPRVATIFARELALDQRIPTDLRDKISVLRERFKNPLLAFRAYLERVLGRGSY
jgi:hypothetical protein